jgi:16S rRNA (cytosine967-C5)-methyltransferase
MLRQVLERGVPLDALLDETHGTAHFRALPSRDRGLARAILTTALRRRGQIEAALTARLDRPLPPGSESLAAILHVAAAQILFLDVPDHAAVDLAVTQAAGDHRSRNARGLVNSVLRRLARERAAVVGQSGAGRVNTPPWLFERWSAAYGEHGAEKITEAHLRPPGLDFSVRADAELWAERLGGAVLPTGTVRVPDMRRVSALAGYEEGAWWVQDAAAALPARLLGDVAGLEVADLCAAPGGKTAELAVAGARVTAVDLSEKRLKRVAANLARLRLQAEPVVADVLQWEPGRRFDAVLLDAPCSATGTIRRHPDVQWLKAAGGH